jgi:hypothetical protein
MCGLLLSRDGRYGSAWRRDLTAFSFFFSFREVLLLFSEYWDEDKGREGKGWKARFDGMG